VTVRGVKIATCIAIVLLSSLTNVIMALYGSSEIAAQLGSITVLLAGFGIFLVIELNQIRQLLEQDPDHVLDHERDCLSLLPTDGGQE
jgi:hypothetical protein